MLEEILSEVKNIVERYSKKLKALVVFGSFVYSQCRSRDIDLMIIVDTINNIDEKNVLEVEITRSLRRVICNKIIDVTVFDVEMFRENLEPGGLASGLVIGYVIIWDELNIPKLVREVAEKMARDNIVLVKSGKKLNLSAISKAKILSSYE